MKLQNIIYVHLLMLVSALHASDAETLAKTLAKKTEDLRKAQAALSATLGQTSGDTPEVGSTALTYKNATNLPIILSVAADGMISRQEILPNATYIDNIINIGQVAIEAHANLSPIFVSNYAQTASYSITINEQSDLALTQTAPTGSVIVNNSGWPVIVVCNYANNDSDEAALQPGEDYTPPAETITVIVTPAIDDIGNPVGAGKSCTITNNKGELVLQF